MKNSLNNDLKGKLIFVKMDCATRQLRSFFGINVQYYNERKKQTEIKTLACVDIERKHTSEQMCCMFNSTLRKYEVPTENVLALVVDNASNMTKTVERLNKNDTSALLEEAPSLLEEDDGDDDNELPSLVRIYHMRCTVQTLQLSIKDGLKQLDCNKLLTKTRHVVAKLRSPNVFSLLEKREKKRPVLDMCTRWGSTQRRSQNIFRPGQTIKLTPRPPHLIIFSITFNCIWKNNSNFNGTFYLKKKQSYTKYSICP